jgi:hypothetical protein
MSVETVANLAELEGKSREELEAYVVDQFRVLIRRRPRHLEKAGVRLAAMLNEALQ